MRGVHLPPQHLNGQPLSVSQMSLEHTQMNSPISGVTLLYIGTDWEQNGGCVTSTSPWAEVGTRADGAVEMVESAAGFEKRETIGKVLQLILSNIVFFLSSKDVSMRPVTAKYVN